MTKPTDLQEGWYWAKPIENGIAQGWGIVYVGGIAPFLTVTHAIVNANSPRWQYAPQRDDTPGLIWEFGARIEFMLEESA